LITAGSRVLTISISINEERKEGEERGRGKRERKEGEERGRGKRERKEGEEERKKRERRRKREEEVPASLNSLVWRNMKQANASSQ